MLRWASKVLLQGNAAAQTNGQIGNAIRGLSVSSAASSPAAAVSAQGDVEGVLREIDRVVSSESVGAKEVTDAAVALAYLQIKDKRRLWGKVFEKVPSVQSSFDGSSLSSFLWAATTAGVGHFKTLAELSGPAAKLLSGLSPAQLSLVIEGLGKAGAKDEAFLAAAATKITSSVATFKPSQLSRILWGYGAAGVENTALLQAVSKALVDKAGELSGREAAQAVWGLARLRRADKATLDTLVRAAKSKLDSPVDAAGLAWALGYIGYPADADTVRALSAALKSGAADLTAAHAVDAAWGLSLLGGDKDAMTALFGTISQSVSAAPDSLDPYQLASVFEAASATDAKLPEQVSAYVSKMHSLVEEGAKAKRSAGLTAFKEELATATATALGARYRPDVAAKVKQFAVMTGDGVHIDIGVALDGNAKIAVEAVGAHYLSSAGTPLGPALSRANLLKAQGYSPVLVTAIDLAAARTPTDKAKVVLNKIKAAVPSAASKVSSLQSDLDKPFDPYA